MDDGCEFVRAGIAVGPAASGGGRQLAVAGAARRRATAVLAHAGWHIEGDGRRCSLVLRAADDTDRPCGLVALVQPMARVHVAPRCPPLDPNGCR